MRKIFEHWLKSFKTDYLYSEVTIVETMLNNKDIRFVEGKFSGDRRFGITGNSKNLAFIEDNIASISHEIRQIERQEQ